MAEQEIENIRQYIEDLCNANPDPLTKSSDLPFRLQAKLCLWDEIEGECHDIVFRYLNINKFPKLLSVYIVRTVCEHLLSNDLKDCLSEEVYKDSTEETDNSITEQDNLVSDNAKTTLLYDVSRLAIVSINKLLSVCQALKNNSTLLSAACRGYVSADSDLSYTDVYDISDCVIKNQRRTQEDKHVVIQNTAPLFGLKPEHNASFFAVYDGHCGLDAARYASCHLHINLVRHPSYPHDMPTALRQAVMTTDNNFIRRAQHERNNSGCTALVLVIYNSVMYWAWLGDAQGTIIRNDQALDIMVPHKPEREDERKRIGEAGGCVVWMGVWRVNGTLAVARAIGDRDYKPFVIGEPDVYTASLDPDQDQHVILACDGLWDGIQISDAPAIIKQHMTDSDNDHSTVAKALVSAAVHGGSTDNISVIVVRLHSNTTAQQTPGEETQTVDITQDENNEDSNGNEASKPDDLSPDANASSEAGVSDVGDSTDDTSVSSGASTTPDGTTPTDQGVETGAETVADQDMRGSAVCKGINTIDVCIDTTQQDTNLYEDAIMCQQAVTANNSEADKENVPLSGSPVMLQHHGSNSALQALVSCLPDAPSVTPSMCSSSVLYKSSGSGGSSDQSQGHDPRPKLLDSSSSINVHTKKCFAGKPILSSTEAQDRSRSDILDSGSSDRLSQILGPRLSNSSGGHRVKISSSGDGSMTASGRGRRLSKQHAALIHSFRGLSTSDADSGSPKNAARMKKRSSSSSVYRSNSSHTTTKSDGSASITEMALMSKTAAKCVSMRRAKRSKTARNGIGRNGRANSAMWKSLAPKGPCNRSGVVQNSDHMFHVLTGWNAGTVRRVKSARRWTVAREIDDCNFSSKYSNTNQPPGVAVAELEPDLAQALFQ